MNAPQSLLQVTHTSSVTPDQIDELGHMNVRWYGHNAAMATQSLCADLGLGDPDLISTYTRHHHEQMEGNELEVRSGLVAGTRSLRIYHELRNSADDDLAATFVHELDHPLLEAPTIELPDYGRPRTLSLDSDGISSAPSLATVKDRDLAIRLERLVSTEDTGGADSVPSWLANNLIWGGERPTEEDDWILTTENGDRIAFATMETRLWIGELPRLGTQIQSFGAVVDLGEKISRGINWVFDLQTEQPLAVFEVINLAFDITARRSTVMPDVMRTERAERYHPDLAPS